MNFPRYPGPYDYDTKDNEPIDPCSPPLVETQGTLLGPAGMLSIGSCGSFYTNSCIQGGNYVLHHTYSVTNEYEYVTNVGVYPSGYYNKKGIITHYACDSDIPDVSKFYINWGPLDKHRGTIELTYEFIEEIYGYWRWKEIYRKTEYWYIIMPDGVPPDICPPGTEFNHSSGTCHPLPDWEWNGEQYVPKHPGVPSIKPKPPGYVPSPDNTDDTLIPGQPQDCIKTASCILPDQVELIPDNTSDIVPPGYDSILDLTPDGDDITNNCGLTENCIGQ